MGMGYFKNSVFYKSLYLRQLLNSSLYDVHVKLEILANYLWKEYLMYIMYMYTCKINSPVREKA